MSRRYDVKGKNILITGASSGIGEACARLFAANGANLILCGRTIEALEKLKKELTDEYDIVVDIRKIDVRELSDVTQFFDELAVTGTNIDILLNNAGLALGLEKLNEGSFDDWDTMIDTNIKGLLYFSKLTSEIMIAADRFGQIINIGSIAGIAAYPNGAVYCATKSAVHVISDGMRMDLVDKNIRITNIQPGMVETNFSNIRFHGDKQKAADVYKGITPLTAEDVADTVYYAATVPENVQICEITLTPIHQATGGILYRKNS